MTSDLPVPNHLLNQETIDALDRAVVSLRFKITDQQYMNGSADNNDVAAYQTVKILRDIVSTHTRRKSERKVNERQ